jgi:hypothetical protein
MKLIVWLNINRAGEWSFWNSEEEAREHVEDAYVLFAQPVEIDLTTL